MAYVDGFVASARDRNAYLKVAARAAAVFREHGATRVVECWGDDVPDGKVTDFRRAVQAGEGDTVVFSWIEWPDKATRDAGMAKVMADERMKPEDGAATPFDMTTMIYGDFLKNPGCLRRAI